MCSTTPSVFCNASLFQTRTMRKLGFEPTGALPFVGCHYGMLATVDFNDQLLLEADEVDDVRS